MISSTNKHKQQLFLVKDPQRLLTRRSNTVYRLNCSCEFFYIGQTRRNLEKGLEEHQSSPDSEVSNHLQSNPTHNVNILNPQYIPPAQTNTNF